MQMLSAEMEFVHRPSTTSVPGLCPGCTRMRCSLYARVCVRRSPYATRLTLSSTALLLYEIAIEILAELCLDLGAQCVIIIKRTFLCDYACRTEMATFESRARIRAYVHVVGIAIMGSAYQSSTLHPRPSCNGIGRATCLVFLAKTRSSQV
jgi:hypothetical protein